MQGKDVALSTLHSVSHNLSMQRDKKFLYLIFFLVFRIKDGPQPQDLHLPRVPHGEGKGIFCFDSWL